MGGLAALFLVGHSARAAAQSGPPYLELVETVVDANVWPEGQWSLSDGALAQSINGGNYKDQHTWSPPPATMDASGFDLTLNVAGQIVCGPLYQGTGASSGSFVMTPDEGAQVNLIAEGDPCVPASGTGTVTIHVAPQAYLADGDVVDLWIGASYGPGVTYRYRVSDTAIDGDDDDDDGDDRDDEDQEGPLRVEVDCPTDIVIGALPGLNCALMISGYRRNTADPVEVITPQKTDGYGNHANGIQLYDIEGAADVFEWVGTRRWNFGVYACQAPNIGANCYESIAVPGPATVEVIVQQKGLEPVRVLLSFNVISRGDQASGIGPLVRIGSLWNVGAFINVENGTPDSSTILLDWLSARWTLDPVEGTNFVRIHSAWKPDDYLHVENGELESGPIQPAWESAMWEMEQAGDGFVRFRNGWQSDQYLNVEDGVLESSPIGGDWISAMWWLLQ